MTANSVELADDAQPAAAVDPSIVAMYGAVQDGPFLIPAVDGRRVEPEFLRQVVPVPANVPDEPGTIVVDPAHRFLYLVGDDGQAIRYGIGVGREGFAWSGTAAVQSKQEWPKWFPPADMMARDPNAAPWTDGMSGGLRNPLGARALYLWQGDKDTLYRIHGTNEPWSIGRDVSSGCIRMFNQDAIDLYNRVPEGTKVVVLPVGPSVS
jgi:lipoprotein-anchoring transpeptidase ErfK/SrfK